MSAPNQIQHHVTEFLLLTIGSITGWAGLNWEFIDLVSGIVLKWVSIISFVLIIVINFNTIKEKLLKVKSKKKNP